MAVTRRHWRTVVEMEPDGVTVRYVQVIYYLEPAADRDNPDMVMPGKQESARSLYEDLEPAEQVAVDAFVLDATRPIADRLRPINPGPKA